MHRLESYTHEFINPFLLQQKSLLNIKLLKEHNTEFSQVILNISLNRLKSDEDYPIILTQQYLENITAQKIFFSKKETAYVGTTKTFRISLLTTLRKRNMYNFLDYFFYVLLPAYNRRYGLLPLGNTSKFKHEISIQDLTLLFDLKHFFEDNVKLKIIFNQNTSGDSFKKYLSFFGYINY